MISTFWMPPRVQKFAAQHPEIRLDLRSKVTLDDILKGDADIAIRLGDPVSQSLIGRRTCKLSFSLFATQDYFAKYGKPTQPSELKDHRIARYAGDNSKITLSLAIEEIVEKYGLKTGGLSDSLIVQANIALQGDTMVVMPVFAPHHIPNLCRVLPDLPIIDADVWLLTHRDLQKTARIRAVIDFLFLELKDGAQEMAGVLQDTGIRK